MSSGVAVPGASGKLSRKGRAAVRADGVAVPGLHDPSKGSMMEVSDGSFGTARRH